MRIHFMGIGGVGMAGLAVLMKARGYEVSGCDLHPTPRTDWLCRQGIAVSFGHNPSHASNVDELVVTPAVSELEPELLAFRREGVRVRYRGEVLAEVASSCDSIAVCGSHGKTTTSTFIAKLLKALGDDPAWCIGGETGVFPVAGVGKGPLVVEADESDGTLALYSAKVLVVNKCEYDHPDHFKTVEDYFACYEEAKRHATVVIDSERLPAIPELDRFNDLAPHNRVNARAAVEVALQRGHSLADIVSALPSVIAELPDRRFQKLAEGVYTDYAHHPTEMQCAISMARKICPGKLRVLFQPHRFSRTKALLADFAGAFEGADEVVLCPTYPAFEHSIVGGTIADLYAQMREDGVDGLHLACSCAEAWTHAKRSMAEGDLTLLLGAGDIISLVPMVTHGETLLPRKIWIGKGTNTWRSELNLGVEYVESKSHAGLSGATLLADPEIGPHIPWMAGIPGTIGGWVKMNAGAFGHSISEVISEVLSDGRWRSRQDCGFGYRTSAIDGEIQDVRFDLSRPISCTESADDFRSRRLHFPPGTWGSFFKNPPGEFAGRLLEAAGAKKLSVGGAHVWSEHANVIVAGEGATPSDVLALALLMRSKVSAEFGIDLEFEVCGLKAIS